MDSTEEVLNLYKKATEQKKPIKDVLLSEKNPSTENVKIEESLNVVEDKNLLIKEIVEASDNSSKEPLEGFLHKLVNILKTSPPKLVKIVEDIKENNLEPLETKKVIIKPKQNLEETKNSNIKKAALELIENLKSSKEPINISKRSVKKLPTKKKKEEIKENVYVQELEKADNKTEKEEEKNENKNLEKSINKIVEKQVKEFFSKFRGGVVAEGGGGDGNFAKEFRNGGTMDGTLNVTGQYLSGGVDLASVFSGGSLPDRLIAGTESFILSADGTLSIPDDTIRIGDSKTLSLESENTSLSSFTKIALSPAAFYAYDSNNNSITFDNTDNEIVLTTLDDYNWTFKPDGKLSGPNNILDIEGDLNTTNKILSGGTDLVDIFLTAETDSQTLSWNASSYELSISNGNIISLSSLSAQPIVTYTYLFDYVPNTSYSGKAVTGSLESNNVWIINRTIFTETGSVSATGKATNVAWTNRLSAVYV